MAAVQDMSVDAAKAALCGIFFQITKMSLSGFLGEQRCFTLLLTGFGKRYIKHCKVASCMME